MESEFHMKATTKIARTTKSRKRPTKNRAEKPLSEMTNPEIAIGAMRLAGRSEAHIAEQLRGEAQRYLDAAERVGFVPPPPLPDPDPYALALKHVASCVGGLIVKACDELGEELASYTEAGGDDYNVRQALRSLWQARWELGISRVDGEAAQYWVEDNARRVREENEPAKVAS
jgi:hypothetical protein